MNRLAFVFLFCLTHLAAQAAGTREIAFPLHLPAGRTPLQGWFQDAEGRDLCDSFFANLLRKP